MSYDDNMVESYLQGLNGQEDRRNKILDEMLPVDNATLIDYGCGDGGYLRHVSRRLAKGYGFDKSDSMIRKATEQSEQHKNLKFDERSKTIIPLADNVADVGLTSFVLIAMQSEKEIDTLNEEFYRVLKPGGKLLHLIPHPCFADRLFGDYRTSHNRTGLAYSASEAPFQYVLRTQNGEEHTGPDFIDFHHTFEFHLNSLADAKFTFEKARDIYIPSNPHFNGETKLPAYLALLARKPEVK